MERRRYTRIKREVPLRIKHNDYDFVGQTRDISCIGAYFTASKYVPLFSVISIILLLPLNRDDGKMVSSIRCKGVVVRSAENLQNRKEYNIAVYFNSLRPTDKNKLSQYVQQYL